MLTYRLLIIYEDGSQKIIEHVNTYGIDKDTDCFYFAKNGYRGFVPKDRVLFFGRDFDLSEEE